MKCNDINLYKKDEYPKFSEYCVGSYSGTFKIGVLADVVALAYLLHASTNKARGVTKYQGCAKIPSVPLQTTAWKCYAAQISRLTIKNIQVNFIVTAVIIATTAIGCSISHSVITSKFTLVDVDSAADRDFASIECNRHVADKQCIFSSMEGQCDDKLHFIQGPIYSGAIELVLSTLIITPAVTTTLVIPLGDRMCRSAGHDIQCETMTMPIITTGLSILITNAIVAGFDGILTKAIIGSECDPVCKYRESTSVGGANENYFIDY